MDLKRLMNDGYTSHMYYTILYQPYSSGHASIYTGTTPSTHGIVGNDWFNKATGKDMYCTDDASVKTLGVR
jgi:predicted AlkP superfamily pyrophosphatase or phosphodiesterase